MASSKPYIPKRNVSVQSGSGLPLRDNSTQIVKNESTYNRAKDYSDSVIRSYDQLCAKVLWSRDATIQWCQENGLIATEVSCSSCGSPMSLVPAYDRKDHVKWECRSRSKQKRHRVQQSVRKNTWFEETI